MIELTTRECVRDMKLERRSIAQPQRKFSLSRTADLYAKRIECRLSALYVGMCVAQHLSLPAHCCLSSPGPDAAGRPVEGDICCNCEIQL
jgi:hypothetical protein